MASTISKEATMNDFIITEDFPNSEIEFDQRFSNTEACYEYLAQVKWPDGFICEKCGYKTYWLSAENIYICKRCEYQVSLTAGTIMHGTKKPITYWFKAMWWFTTRKSGVNAVNLRELLGLGSYHTAWTWLQKLRRCTIRKDRERLSGRVEVDEFFIGGKKSGKRGRGAEGKTIVLVAIERDTVEDPDTLNQYWQIGRVRLQVALDCSAYSLETFISHNIETGSTVVTDKLNSYPPALTGYHHIQVEPALQKDPESGLYGTHLIASLVKRLIRGTFQGRFEPKYLQNYLDEYVFRFNRRKSKSIGKKFMRIVQQVIKSCNIRKKDIQFDLDPLSEYFSLGFCG
jgi:hypothetical protein